ncbi:MAG: MFS transporter [Haloarculaceae archaeon]
MLRRFSVARWPYRNTVLTLCTAAFFVTMVARLSVSPVVPAITDAFGISKTFVGVALTGMWMAYSLAQFPSGVVADRFGERRVILVAVGGTVLATLALAAAPVFAVFVVCTVLLGVVAGFHYSVATTLLSRTYDDIGTAVGIHNGGAPAAGLVTPVAAAWVWSQYGWRPAVALAAVVGVPVVALFAWRIRPTPARRPDQPMRERFEIGSITELLSRSEIAFTMAIAVAMTFVWQGTASFLPTFLVEHRDQSLTTAGTLFSAYFVVQGVVQVGVGAVSDRYGRDPAMAGCMAAASAGVAALVLVPGLPGAVAGVALLGVGMSYGAAMIPRFMDHLSTAEQGAGIGLVRTVYGIVGALGSVGVGFLADTWGWPVSFGVLVVLMALVFAALAANRLLSLGY